jgi:nitronate monooxygenase
MAPPPCRWRPASPYRRNAACPTRQQEYFKAGEDDIEVKRHFAHRLPHAHAEEQPRHRRRHPPNCEAYGYLLDSNGSCQYIEAYNREVALHPEAGRRSR